MNFVLRDYIAEEQYVAVEFAPAVLRIARTFILGIRMMHRRLMMGRPLAEVHTRLLMYSSYQSNLAKRYPIA